MISRIINYFTSSYDEMKKVVWPNRAEVISHTIIVVASIGVSMAIVAALDYGFFSLAQIIIYKR